MNPELAPIAVSLRDLIDALEMMSEETHAYVDRETGKIEMVSDESLRMAEDDDASERVGEWQKEEIRLARQILDNDRYVHLPDEFDIDEYRSMERFCLRQPGELGEELLDAIKGKGAFGRFKSAIHRHGIEKDWFGYKEQALKELALVWLEEIGMAFTDDLKQLDS